MSEDQKSQTTIFDKSPEDLRAELFDDPTGTNLSRADIIFAMENDFEFFAQFFLGEEFDMEIPAFHIELLQTMTLLEIVLSAFAVPRDHAKTTYAKLACVYLFLFSDFRFIVYTSSTLELAVNSVQDITAFFEAENFQRVFGEVQFYYKQDGKGKYKFRVNNKICILRALGAQQSVRGINIDHQRPQFLILDDIEDPNEITTDAALEKLDRWLYGPLLKALNKKKHKVVHLGNLTANKCLLASHLKSNFWHSYHYGCLKEDGTPLWPDKWTIAELQLDFAMYREKGLEDLWFAEMMNIPTAGGHGLIESSQITYAPPINPKELVIGFFTIDLSISEKEHAHKTCIATHIWNGERWQIAMTSEFHGLDPVRLYQEVKKLSIYWGIYICGIESVAYQASVKFVFEHLSKTDFTEYMQYFQIPVGRVQKYVRLTAWAGLLRNQHYCLSNTDFLVTQQLLEYNPKAPNNSDDTIDACAHGIFMIDNHAKSIWDQHKAKDHWNVNRENTQFIPVTHTI